MRTNSTVLNVRGPGVEANKIVIQPSDKIGFILIVCITTDQ